MSQKSLRKRRQGTPRAMPVETIVTRFKSAQQKSQHEQKQKKSIIKIKKRNKRTTKTSSTIKKTVKGVVEEKSVASIEESKDIDNNEEYYPEKLRRTLTNKKVVLAAKPTYKLVGGLKSFNKRKLRIPNKEIIELNKFHSTTNEKECNSGICLDKISICDSDSLDEEDLLEILTCPSPVWWEDPPDDDDIYDEEPISIDVKEVDALKQQVKSKKVKEQNNKIITQSEQNDLKVNKVSHNVTNKDKNYIIKRNKLETLLDNIKSNTSKAELDKKMESKDHSRSNILSPVNKKQKTSSESCDEELLDVCYDDDILRTFENIDIPIKNTSPIALNTNRDRETKSESAVKVLKFDSEVNSPLSNSQTKATPIKGLTIKNIDITKFKPNKKDEITTKFGQNIRIKKNKMLLLKKLPEYCDMKIVKESDEKIGVSKKGTRNVFTKEHNHPPITGLTIKNWDMHFMKQGDIKVKTNEVKNIEAIEKKKNIVDEISSQVLLQNNNENKSSDANNLDHVTVYKIISEHEDVMDNFNPKIDIEVNNEFNTRLSSYCKNINKSNKDTTASCRSKTATSASKVESPSVKSISVSDNKTIKYCGQCSSIFDSDTCKYCATKLKKVQENEKL